MKFKSIAFHHFGCKVNFAEASSLAGNFRDKGLEVKDFHEQADVYVISTCVVTAVAEKKCRAAIRQAHKLNPDAKIAVIGCFSELKPDELKSMEGVDIVLGHSGKFHLTEALEKLDNQEYPASDTIESELINDPYHFVPSYSSNDRTRSFLKIQDGCDYFCSYCTIPLARGKSRSDTITNILKEVDEIASKGIREIVLTGVNIGDFGKITGEKLIDLLHKLETRSEIPRFRISSIEPDLLTDDIISLVASSERFLPHFHIPLQSGSNDILAAMRRKYSRELYASRVKKIKELMPYACIAADVIVGFPGESEAHFLETYSFLEEIPVSYLHVFTYSRRDRTKAALSGEHLPEIVKKRRSEMLHTLSIQKKEIFYAENKGRLVDVLFESENSHGFMEGFSENYIRVRTPYNPLLVNQITQLTLERQGADGVYIYNPENE